MNKKELKALQQENLRKGGLLYDECLAAGCGRAVNRKWGALHFNVAVSIMKEEETVILTFIGDLRDARNTSKGTWAFILTQDRLIYGQAGMMGNKVKSLGVSSVNAVDYYPSALMGRIEVKTLTEKFAVIMGKQWAVNVYSKLDGALLGIAQAKETFSDEAMAKAANRSKPEMLKEWMDLYERGAITEEEFEKMKAEILSMYQ